MKTEINLRTKHTISNLNKEGIAKLPRILPELIQGFFLNSDKMSYHKNSFRLKFCFKKPFLKILNPTIHQLNWISNMPAHDGKRFKTYIKTLYANLMASISIKANRNPNNCFRKAINTGYFRESSCGVCNWQDVQLSDN